MNHKDLIDIENIPLNERDKYLDFFSEESIELRNCLETLWNMNLYTSACCKGHNLTEKIYTVDGKDYYFIDLYSYICMKPNNYITPYLSKELLLDPYVEISKFDDNREAIYIYGRERLNKLNKLTEVLKTGKKNNDLLVDVMTNKRISYEYLNKAYREYYYDNNFYFEEIKRIEEINEMLTIDSYIKHLNDDIIKKVCDEHNDILRNVRMRNLKRTR